MTGYLITDETFEMKFITNSVQGIVLEILRKLSALPHLLQVEQSHARVEPLQAADLPVLGAGVLLPELGEGSSVEGRHVLGQTEQLAGQELIKLLVETFEAVFELDVSIDHNELLEGKDQVIEWRDVKEILNKHNHNLKT